MILIGIKVGHETVIQNITTSSRYQSAERVVVCAVSRLILRTPADENGIFFSVLKTESQHR